MSSEWRETTLGDFVALRRGHDLTQPQRKPGRVPVLGSAGQNGFHDTALAKGPGVVIGRSGASFGQVHYSPQDFWPHNTALYVTDFNGNDPRFAFYFLKAIDFSRYNSGSAQQSLNRNFIYPISILLPPLPAQRAIAGVLGSLDDKIELNRRTSGTLEKLARAIFRAWFVNFEPVKAKAAGARSFPSMPQEAFDALPTRLVPSELGPIPEGWEVRKIGDFGEIRTGRTPSTKEAGNFGEEVPFFTPSDLGEARIITETRRALSPQGYHKVRTAQIPAGSIMVSCIGSAMGKTAIAGGDGVSNQQINSVVCSRDEYREFLLWNLVGREEELRNLGAGGSAQPILNKGDFSRQETLLPTAAVVRSFHTVTRRLLEKMEDNTRESRKLATLRDYLLPKLLSGEVRAPDAESMLDETRPWA